MRLRSAREGEPPTHGGRATLTPVSKRSAGILLYRLRDGELEVLLAHMGGPFWERREAGAWTVPKGELDDDEDELTAARREFEEELGSPPPDGPAIDLGEIRQGNRKRVRAWAIEGDFDPARLRSNLCEIEWPPRSGRVIEIPEIDRAEWFRPDEIGARLIKGQMTLIERLIDHLAAD